MVHAPDCADRAHAVSARTHSRRRGHPPVHALATMPRVVRGVCSAGVHGDRRRDVKR